MKRQTQNSLRRFHERSSTSPDMMDPPSAMEQAAANAFALLLGGVSASSPDNADRIQARQSLSGLHASAKPLPLMELCLKSESSLIFGAHIITAAVEALALNRFLQVLDVSGNECGDVLAVQLGAVLRVNKSLQVLFWDDNFTTVDGFFHFYDGLAQNQTLVMVQMPIKDTRRVSWSLHCTDGSDEILTGWLRMRTDTRRAERPST